METVGEKLVEERSVPKGVYKALGSCHFTSTDLSSCGETGPSADQSYEIQGVQMGMGLSDKAHFTLVRTLEHSVRKEAVVYHHR